jgi:hypothetical protein
MISGDHKDLGRERKKIRDHGIRGLDGGHLPLEVAIFTPGIGPLQVEKVEVKGPEMGSKEAEGLGIRRGDPGDLHPDKPCDPTVHRIPGPGGAPESEPVLKDGKALVPCEASGKYPVNAGLGREDPPRLSDKRGQEISRPGGRGIEGSGWERGNPLPLGVGVRERIVEPRPAKHEDGPMFLLMEELEGHVLAQMNPVLQPLHREPRLVIRRASGSPVHHPPLRVQRREVQANREISILQVKPNPERTERASPHDIPKRIIPEQREMGGTTPRGHPWRHGGMKPKRALGGKGIQMRGAGRLELGETGRGMGEPAKPVQYEEDDAGTGSGIDEVVGEDHSEI